MKRWIADADMEAWTALHQSSRTSVFRVEAQQIYRSDSENAAVARFMAGEPHGLSFEFPMNNLARSRELGITRDTVRIVVEPPTDYTRWELSVYPEFDAAGERVHVLPVREDSWPTGIPRHDFFLFDDERVWRMHYDADRAFVGAALLDEPEEIALYRRWRDAALKQAVSIHDYLATHPENGRPPAA